MKFIPGIMSSLNDSSAVVPLSFAFYEFEDPGGPALDTSGNGNHSSLDNNTKKVAYAKYGTNCGYLDGTARWLFDLGSQLNTLRVFSISINIRLISIDNTVILSCSDSDNLNGFSLQYQQVTPAKGDVILYVGDSSTFVTVNAGNITKGRFVNICLNIDLDGDVYFYVDSVLAGSVTVPSPIAISSTTINFPGSIVGRSFSLYSIDNLRFFDRFVTPSEISILSNEGAFTGGTYELENPDLISYYDFVPDPLVTSASYDLNYTSKLFQFSGFPGVGSESYVVGGPVGGYWSIDGNIGADSRSLAYVIDEDDFSFSFLVRFTGGGHLFQPAFVCGAETPPPLDASGRYVYMQATAAGELQFISGAVTATPPVSPSIYDSQWHSVVINVGKNIGGIMHVALDGVFGSSEISTTDNSIMHNLVIARSLLIPSGFADIPIDVADFNFHRGHRTQTDVDEFHAKLI